MKVKVSNMRIFSALAVVAVMLLTGCSGYKDIRVDSCRLESISPVGLKALDAGFSVSVDNPVKEILISDIDGTVYYDGGEFGHFEAPPVTVPGKSVSDVRVDVRAALSKSLTLMQVMSMATAFDPSEFTVDISLTVKVKGGLKKKVELKGLPVDQFFRKTSYESI